MEKMRSLCKKKFCVGGERFLQKSFIEDDKKFLYVGKVLWVGKGFCREVCVYGERSVQGSLYRKGKVCIQKFVYVGKSLFREVYEGRKNWCREVCVGMEMCKWVGRSLRIEIVQEGDFCIYIEICVFMKE